jgi:hypothetical protein
MTRGDVLIERTVVDFTPIPGQPTYYVAQLNAALPETITPAKLLPEDWESYIPGRLYAPIPVIATDQEKHASVSTMRGSSYFNPTAIAFATPTNAKQLEFYEGTYGGDSSSPVFAKIGDDTVLITSWWYGGSGTPGGGWSYAYGYNEIVAAINTLYGSVYPHPPEIVDLSGFPKF